MPTTVDSILLAAEEHAASDVFLGEGEFARLKIQGKLSAISEEPLEHEALVEFWRACGGDVEYDADRDTSYTSSSGRRFRVNLHRHTGRLGAVLRQLTTDIPEMISLGLPRDQLARWVQHPSGLILVTGATGSGKSTTLASMLEWVNIHLAKHVVTIEDPIEYLFTSKESLFTQREVYTDTDSFARGLRSSLRQAPDIILLGEIRDPETAAIALQAAETGHLVLATLHSTNVGDTLERLTNLFPTDERNSQLALVAQHLVGIICQRLLPGIDGHLTLAVETMQNEGATRTFIRECRYPEIFDFMNRNDNPNNVTFTASLVELTKAGKIDENEAAAISGNPNDFKRALRGISS
ncbi:MAG: pilus retraction protein PilT [Verrucomicrobiales bacterium]|jgi:pilus retraction protein PilT